MSGEPGAGAGEGAGGWRCSACEELLEECQLEWNEWKEKEKEKEKEEKEKEEAEHKEAFDKVTGLFKNFIKPSDSQNWWWKWGRILPPELERELEGIKWKTEWMDDFLVRPTAPEVDYDDEYSIDPQEPQPGRACHMKMKLATLARCDAERQRYLKEYKEEMRR